MTSPNPPADLPESGPDRSPRAATGPADLRAQARRDLAITLAAIRTRGPKSAVFWTLALAVGVASGFAAVGFRLAIDFLQSIFYRTDQVERLHSVAAELAWYWVLCIPILGGLVVGILVQRFTDDGRVSGVADVIEAAALHDAQLRGRRGLVSSLASLITLSTGGSTGREGPVVHLAAIFSSTVARWIKADGITGRDLLGCAVAAAVSASFNAPIAGALFALEVVLRHFAVHAFAPIAIASVAGTVVNRLCLGDYTEFSMPTQPMLAFYQELPAFMILGLLCGIVAVVLMRSIFWADAFADSAIAASGLPPFLRPAVTGALLGVLAIWWPHIIGVGYETTARALSGQITLAAAVVFIVIKVAAVAITMAGRMGGGMFSPSLMIGALTGVAFGLAATSIFPDVSGSHTLYALAGMGGVAAAVLGAPISSTMIVFELTGDWQTGLAVMVTVSLASALASRVVDRSFFLTQIERRGIHIAAGPQAWLMATFPVADLMRPVDGLDEATQASCAAQLRDGIWIGERATLEDAMALLDASDSGVLAVVRQSGNDAAPQLCGALFHLDALKALNRALATTAAEEHS